MDKNILSHFACEIYSKTLRVFFILVFFLKNDLFQHFVISCSVFEKQMIFLQEKTLKIFFIKIRSNIFMCC